MERWLEAEQNFRKAIALQSPLVRQFPDMPYYSLWLATFRIALADCLIRKDQTREARAELEEAISALLQQQARRPETPPPHDLLALGYSKLSIALRQSGEIDQAADAAKKAEQERNASRNLQ